MKYIEFWKTKGHDYITPSDMENPEGFDVGKVLKDIFKDDDVLEVGCGRGRLAGFFDPMYYTGYDINEKSLQKASDRYPDHSFHDKLVKNNNVLLYTVCLHIPDDLIIAEMKKICKGRKKVVIAEIMERKYRHPMRFKDEYSLSNQRDLGEYAQIMRELGFELSEEINHPYKHYKGANITFAVFNAIKPVGKKQRR